MPNHDMLAVMSNYMEEMGKAGVLLSAEGFQPSSKGARVKFSQGKPKVTNGPFDKSDGLVAGYCLIHGILRTYHLFENKCTCRLRFAN